MIPPPTDEEMLKLKALGNIQDAVRAALELDIDMKRIRRAVIEAQQDYDLDQSL